MNLQEITESLETNYRAWGAAYQDELEAASGNPAIQQRVIGFIHEAIDSPQAKTGNPLTATKNALRLSAFANFRFGLLVGILLHSPDKDEDRAPETLLLPDVLAAPCPSCLGTGLVCLRCGQPQADCSCEEEFDPVDCDACDGKGEL